MKYQIVQTFISKIGGGYLETCLETSKRLEKRILKSPSRLGLVTPKSRLGLDFGPVCLESRLRHFSDVGKAHKCCKYVMIFSKNRLFVRFL